MERFWSKVDKSGECWPWMGARTPRGYGAFSVGTKDIRAHRMAWELTHGPIPEGMMACHHCDNPSCVRPEPSCVRPEHLFLGTHADNMADKVRKRRQTHGSHNHNTTKLTERDIPHIRGLYTIGFRQVELAAMYGIAQTTCSDIVRRKIWRHVVDGAV